MNNQKRGNGKVAKLPVQHRDTVEQMLLSGMSYREVVEYLKQNGHVMSQMAIHTYAKKYLASVQQLNIAQENFRMMMEELDRFPNLDTTEGIVRILSGYMFNAISSLDSEDWRDDIDPEQLFRQANALIRAASYKKRTDIQNQNSFDASIEASRVLIFEALAKDRPDLYKEISKYLSEQRKQGDINGV